MATDILPIIAPIPDDNTSEAIMFGSAYRFAKSSQFFWDAVEDETRKEIERLKGQLINREYCAYVMRTSPQMALSRRPPVSHPDKIKDLWTLRRIINLGSGLEHIDRMRRQNRMWSVMKGAREYTSGLMDRGELTEAQWKAATDGFDTNVDYDSVRSILDLEETRSVSETETILDDYNEYLRKCEAFERDYENAMRLRDELKDEDSDDDGDDGFPDIRIVKEIETPVDDLSEIFDDTDESDGIEPQQSDVPIPLVYLRLGAAIETWLDSDPIETLIGRCA